MRISSCPRRLRLTASVAAVAVASISLAACGSDGPDRTGGGDTVEVWVYQDASTAVQEEFVEQFNETSEIKMNLVQIPGENYQERARTAMGSSNAPDVFFNWGGGSISEFVAEDMLVDLTGVLDEDPAFRDAFVPTILEAGEVEGKNYGIPMRGVQPVILFHNLEVFEEAGVEPPETWEDFTKLIEVFQAQGVTPVALGGADAWTSMMWLEYLLDRHGGAEVWQRIQDGDSDGWGDPSVLQMAETTKELIDGGAFGNNFRSTDYVNDSASTFFAQGGAAMHLMGSWEYANQLANQPEFAESGLGYSAFPVMADGDGDPSALVGNPTNFWSVNSQLEGERLDAAVEFLKLAGSEDYAQALIDNGDVPATAEAEDLLTTHENPEYARFQYDLITSASSFTLSWDQGLPAKPSKDMLNSVEKLFNGQLAPQEFVDSLQDG